MTTLTKMDQRGTDRYAGYRDEKGRLQVGHPGGPGRPPGLDIRRLAEEAMLIEGYDLKEAVWEITRKLIERAKQGDVNATRCLFERVLTAEVSPLVALQINAMAQEQEQAGVNNREVVLPSRRELSEQLLSIHKTATEILKDEDEADALLEVSAAEVEAARVVPQGPKIEFTKAGEMVEIPD